MKKIWKKVMASVLAIALSAGMIGTFNSNTVAAQDTNAQGLEVLGASIRFISENTVVDGIRFAVGVKEDVFNAMSETQKANCHLLVMPTALITDGELNIGETYTYTVGTDTKYAYAQDIQFDWANATTEDGYKVVRIYLNEINASYYTTGITARAYYMNGATPVYSAQIERSYYTVAEKALDDVQSTEDDTYKNQAGNSYSPYTATQRDALLGVKYEKTGTWDYQDGNLVTDGAVRTPENTKILPFVLDREATTTSESYVIETSLRVGFDDNSQYESAATELDTDNKGIVFGYNKDNGSYYLMDIRYRVHATLGRGFWAHLRYFDGVNWDGTVLTHPVAIDPGMYDFRITVDAATEGETVVYVEYKEQNAGDYATLLPSTKNPNATWKDNRTIIGTKVGFTTSRENERVVFGSDIKVYNGGVQTRGIETLPMDTQLNITTEATTIEGSFAYDYRTELCTNTRREGILLGDASKTGYFFCIGDHQSRGAFFISLKKGSNGSWGDVVSGAGFNDLPSRSLVTEKNLTLTDNDEILVKYKIVVTKNASGHNVFVIDYSLNYGDTVIYEKKNWTCEDTNDTQTTITTLYLHSEDSGSPIKDTAVNNHTCGDGKTIYYPVTINGQLVEPGQPSTGDTDDTVTISNMGTLAVDKALSITTEATTIEGSFAYDYRTELCTNTRREGILLGDDSKTGYFFCIGDHAERGAFFISLKKGSNGSWADVNAGAGFNELPNRTLVTEKGLTLQDNDEILVKYKIVVTKNESGHNVFVIDYSLNYGNTVIYEKTDWICEDKNDTQTTITTLYLHSEDNGSPTKDTAVNNHTCGDGKTVYYTTTINGEKVTAVTQ